MEFDEILQRQVQDRLRTWAAEMKAAIEYEFSVEYGNVDIGEPTISDNTITFDLHNLSAQEKSLLGSIYYDNAKKRRMKGGGKDAV